MKDAAVQSGALWSLFAVESSAMESVALGSRVTEGGASVAGPSKKSTVSVGEQGGRSCESLVVGSQARAALWVLMLPPLAFGPGACPSHSPLFEYAPVL